MECVICKIKKVSPLLVPYGGFLCPNGHMQCLYCNGVHNGRCGICGNSTIHMLMIPNPHSTDVAAAQARIASLTVSLSNARKISSFWRCTPNLFDEINKVPIAPLKEFYIKEQHKNDGCPTGRLDTLFTEIHQKTWELSAVTNEVANAAPVVMGKRNIDAVNYLMGQEAARKMPEAVDVIQAEEPFPCSCVVRPKFKNSDVFESQEDGDRSNLQYYQMRHGNFPSDLCEPNENIRPPYATAPDRGFHCKFGKQNFGSKTATAAAAAAAGINDQQAINFGDVKERDAPGLDICLRGIFQNIQEDPKTSQPSFIMPSSVKEQTIPRSIKQLAPTQCATISSSSPQTSATPNVQYSIPDVLRYMTPYPLQCPDSKCSTLVFLSDLQKHFETDHSQLPIECITTSQSKHLLIDPRSEYCGNNKINYIFYAMDDSTKQNRMQKQFVPLLIMSSSLTIPAGELDMPNTVEALIIWVTSIVHLEIPISVALSVCSNTSSGTMPSLDMKYCGKVYSMRKSQQAWNVIRSGQMLMLTMNDVKSLTNGFTDMLHMQLQVVMGHKTRELHDG